MRKWIKNRIRSLVWDWRIRNILAPALPLPVAISTLKFAKCAKLKGKSGDLWICGKHRVLCGDALRPEAVVRLLGGRKPLLIGD